MKTRIGYACRNSVIELLIDDGTKGPDRKVLASMTLFEGTGAWMMMDIRLARYRKPSAYSGSLIADDIRTTFKPDSAEDAERVKSWLREYTEDELGIHWSTYEGLVRGQPRDGALWIARNNHIGFFSRKEGLAHLKEIQAWWTDYEGDSEDAKLDNPLRQLSLTEVICRLAVVKLGLDPLS